MEFIETIKGLVNYTIFDLTIGKLVVFFVILFFFLLFRQIFTKIFLSALRRMAGKTKTTIDDQFIAILEKPINYFLLIVAFYFAFKSLSLSDNSMLFINHILRSFIILLVCWTLARSEMFVNTALRIVFTTKDLDVAISFIPFITKFIKVTLISFAVIFIIQEWGYNIGALITGLGIGGVAIALAAKDTLANFFGSIMILFDRPFKVGDWIVSSDAEGIVEDIGFRSTRIRTFAKALVAVPNSKLATDAITNWSRRDRRRISFNVGVTYSTTKNQMKNIISKIKEMLFCHDKIRSDVIMVNFTDFDKSSMNIFIYCFTTTSLWDEFLEIKQDVNLKVMEILESESAEFAFPSMSIYMGNPPPSLDNKTLEKNKDLEQI